MESQRTHHGAQIISPSITRRPEIDSTLGDMAWLSKVFLEQMRNKVFDGHIPDRDELRNFKDICETVLRQAKTEIELEKHANQKVASLSVEEIRQTITKALLREGIEQKVIEAVIEALGMSPTT